MALPYPGCVGACSPISSTISLKKATVDVFTHLKSASAAVGAPPPRAGCSRWLAHLCSWPQHRGTGAPCGHLHRARVRMASPEGQEEAALSPSSKAAWSLDIQSTLPLLESVWPVLKHTTWNLHIGGMGFFRSLLKIKLSWWREGEGRSNLAACQGQRGTHLTLPLGRCGGHRAL